MLSDGLASPESDGDLKAFKEEKAPYRLKIIWVNVIFFIFLHSAAVYGMYLMLTSTMWKTNAFAGFLYVISGLGVTAGVHRLWTHRTYKATLPLRICLAMFYTITFQKSIYDWCRDHRLHHKSTETDADPHNARRGFFFSHIGWLMVKKHPEVYSKGKTIDLSDILSDPVAQFQRKYYMILAPISCFVLPTVIPMVMWGESFRNAFFVPTLLRLAYTMNVTWLVNSAAHMWGNRPYDMNINPRENIFVSLSSGGEGFHNYHHTFPWDYSTSEYGIRYNGTTLFINVMARLGLAYDLKKATPEMVKERKLKAGSHYLDHDQKIS